MENVIINPVASIILSVVLAGAITILGNYLNMRWTKKNTSFEAIQGEIVAMKKEIETKQDQAKCKEIHAAVNEEEKDFRARIGRESMEHYKNHENTLVTFSRIEKYILFLITKLGYKPSEANL